MLRIIEGTIIANIMSKIRKSLGVFLLLLGVLAIIWFSYVYVVSRVAGFHPVYLQMAGADRMTLRWGSQQAARDTVFYGLSPTELSFEVVEEDAVTNHSVTLSNLLPQTRYYYRIKHLGQWRQDAAEWFMTTPKPGELSQTRIWLLGDPGKTVKKIPVREAALGWLQQHPRVGRTNLDLILTTGDQAYPNATYQEYVTEFLTPYQGIFKNIPVWVVFGNHDARRWSFYQLFDRPQQAEFGGLASNTPSYFSFNYAQTHIVMLDSHDADLSPGSDMLSWLQKDLRQSNQKWTIVLFHHPPYTRGTHDSDVNKIRKRRMTRVRKNVLPVLEKAGVDLVVAGHSHVYERSHLIQNHFGLANTFDGDAMIKDAGKQVAGETVYQKPFRQDGTIIPGGTMYMVLGSSGEGNQGRFDHPALPIASAKAGSVFLDIDNESIRSRYVTEDGDVIDKFVIRKASTSPALQKTN